MKENLLIDITKHLSTIYNVGFIDFDMSAARTRIARYLLHEKQSTLAQVCSPKINCQAENNVLRTTIAKSFLNFLFK